MSVNLSVFATDTGQNARALRKNHLVSTAALVFEHVPLVRGPSGAMILVFVVLDVLGYDWWSFGRSGLVWV